MPPRILLALILGACATSHPPAPPPAPTTAPTADNAAVEAETQRLAAGWKRVAQSFDVTKPLLWSYFFYDSREEPLKRLQPILAERGFPLQGLGRLKDNGQYMLKLVRTEVLTVEGLARRNVDFKALAQANGVETYDGWEVERSDGPR